MEKYEELKKVIVEANRLYPADRIEYEIEVRTLRLADVLLAMRDTEPVGGDFKRWNNDWQRIIAEWDLRHDNLDHQSDETKQFLIDLLIK